MKAWLLVFTALAAGCTAGPPSGGAYRGPIIDVHLHAFQLEFAAGAPACAGDQGALLAPIDPAAEFTPGVLIEGCRAPMHAPATDDALLSETLAQLDRHNIVRAITAGSPADVARWRAAGGVRLAPAIGFATSDDIGVDALREMHARGEIAVFAEVSTQYRGIAADDARYEPFFALAEELDVPVGIHLGEGPPGAARFPGYESYRAGLTSAFQLENVLRRHPRLRIYVMHYGSPLVDDMMAMMYTYPNLYVDVAFNNWGLPRAQFYDHLRRMIDAGYEQRIMFGSDQMIWPGAIGAAVDSINEAPFLSEHQKQLIFYDNAARFLRLTPEQIAEDHGR